MSRVTQRVTQHDHRVYGKRALLLAGQLCGVNTFDPVILGAAAFILGSCAAVACLIPAVRASSVDPVQALRVNN